MEEIIIVAIVFGSILGMVKLILDYAAARRSPSSDKSLTTGELEGLIDEAVLQSTKDLRRRIENLEAIATEERSAGSGLLLDAPGSYGDAIENEAKETRKIKS